MKSNLIQFYRKALPASIFLCASLFAYSAHAGNALQKILETGQVTIGYRKNSKPFSFATESNQPQGYSIDICLSLVQDIRDKLERPDLQVNFKEIDAASRITEVKNGNVDIVCGTSTITKKRLQEVNFSVAFFAGGTQLMVKNSNSAKNADELKGKKIALAADTTSHAVVKYYSDINKLGFVIVERPSQTEAFAALDKGEVDAYASEDAIMWGFANNRQPRGKPALFRILPPNFDVQPYGIIHPKDDPELTHLIDGILIKKLRDGTVTRIYQKWFQDGQKVKTPLPMSRMMRDAIARPSKATVL